MGPIHWTLASLKKQMEVFKFSVNKSNCSSACIVSNSVEYFYGTQVTSLQMFDLIGHHSVGSIQGDFLLLANHISQVGRIQFLFRLRWT